MKGEMEEDEEMVQESSIANWFSGDESRWNWNVWRMLRDDH